MDRTDVNQWKSELMTSEERTLWVNGAFDRSLQGKAIQVPTPSPGIPTPLVLAPGSYLYQAPNNGLPSGLQFIAPSSNVWALPYGAPFYLRNPREFTINAGPFVLIFFPALSDSGVPCNHTFNEGAIAPGFMSINIDFACSFTVVETTNAGVFTRSFNGDGPMIVNYAAGAGSQAIVSARAYI